MIATGRNSAGTRPPSLIDFSKSQTLSMPRSSFDLSHTKKFTFNASFLVPMLRLETVPGDTIRCDSQFFIRYGSQKKPVLDNAYVESFYFRVKAAHIFSKWKNIFGHQETRASSPTDYVIPFITVPDKAYDGLYYNDGSDGKYLHSIWDYMDIPPAHNPDGSRIELPENKPLFSAMWFRAYNNIYNWWFKDQNLQDDVFDPLAHDDDDLDGVDTVNKYTLLRRGKRKDRFTSAYTSPQKFGAVSFSLFGNLPVELGDLSITGKTGANDYPTFDSLSTSNSPIVHTGVAAAGSGAYTAGFAVSAGSNDALYWNNPNLDASGSIPLSGISLFSINDLRLAIVAQQIKETLMINGSRYNEVIKSFFGVDIPEEDLRIPKYLGGGRSNVNMSVVPQTSQTTVESEQGRLTAYGVSTGGSNDGHSFIYSSDDYGYILGIMCVRTDITYQQGLDASYTRRVATDHMIPIGIGLGMETVYNRELFYTYGAYGDDTLPDNQAFGYNYRYSTYKYQPSTVGGLFRSASTTDLDEYHYAEFFADLPTLSEQFITDKSYEVINRTSAVPASQSSSQFLCDVLHKVYVARCLTLDNMPSLGRI